MKQELKEELVFSVINTSIMVGIMLSSNAIRMNGFGIESLMLIIKNYIPVFLAAFLISHLIVSHNVHKIHKIIVKPHDSQFKYILTFSILMVTGMCLSMSLYVTLITVGTDNFWTNYVTAFKHNYPIAVFSQLVIAGPITRIIHMNIFRKSELVN